MDSEVVRRIAVDHTCPDLFPQRVLHVWEVCIEHVLVDWTGEIVQQINIEYTITPPLPNFDRQLGPPFFGLYACAVDDVGTSYMDVGGGYDAGSEDKPQTHGSLTLRTFPPPTNVTSLTITLNLWVRGEARPRECNFMVDLRAPAHNDEV